MICALSYSICTINLRGWPERLILILLWWKQVLLIYSQRRVLTCTPQWNSVVEESPNLWHCTWDFRPGLLPLGCWPSGKHLEVGSWHWCFEVHRHFLFEKQTAEQKELSLPKPMQHVCKLRSWNWPHLNTCIETALEMLCFQFMAQFLLSVKENRLIWNVNLRKHLSFKALCIRREEASSVFLDNKTCFASCRYINVCNLHG